MYFSRKILEDIEDQNLAPYGFRSKNTKGRLYPEQESEYRTCFQRDRDRILHTTAFRRLEYKTQVFINYEGDHYRTRLTHTLEVNQIGRTIARVLGANEDLVEAICLSHDLGHPPFGHSGEIILAKLMADHGGFEHNKHSLRIITELEQRYPDFPGLNLTWETLEGIVKHETEYDISDASDFNPELRGPIEAQIANIADELAYTTHDLDDGLRSSMISPFMLSDIELWKLASFELGEDGKPLDDMMRHRAIRFLIGIEVSDLVNYSSQVITKAKLNSAEELQRLPNNVVSFSPEFGNKHHQLKDFLYNNLYRHYRVVRMAEKAEKIVTSLFEAYLKEPLTLPTHVQQKIENIGLEKTICDHIAGMTDRYAIEEYQKLFDPVILP